ncbi:MAG: pyridoxal phosphate-dependent aminotransferase [Oligoflexales bacterium]
MIPRKCYFTAFAYLQSYALLTYSGGSLAEKNRRNFEIPLAIEATASATLEANKIRNERLEQNKVVYDWGLGANPMPVPEKIKKAVADNCWEKSYGSPRGISELGEIIASRYSLPNYRLAKENVIVAPGLKQLLNDVQLAFAGPIVHITPHWVSYDEQVKIHHKQSYKIETSDDTAYMLTPIHIEKFISNNPSIAQQTKLVIFNHPTNPTGVAYSKEEIISLARAFTEHNFIVFADEVYLGNTYDGETISIAEWMPERTIRASSLSKEYGLGGYRLGWATFPNSLKPLNDLMFAIGTSSYSCASKPAQYAAIAALSGGEEIDSFIQKGRSIFEAAAAVLAARFRELDLLTVAPNAAWYFLLDFSKYQNQLKRNGINDSIELCARLAKELGIIFVPGEAFGLKSPSFKVRASFVDFKPVEALAWLKNRNTTSDHREGRAPPWMNKMLESTKELEQWLNKM